MKVWKRLVPILAITSLMIAAKPSISAGSNTTTGNHTVGITTSGEAYACGYNRSGPLGDGTTTDRWTPVLVSPRP